MEKSEIIKKLNSILDRVTVIDKERETLVQELKDIFPIKEGEKVSIRTSKDDTHVRFAFVHKIEIELRGKERKSNIEYTLEKCKVDGTKSQQADYLRYQEYVIKAK